MAPVLGGPYTKPLGTPWLDTSNTVNGLVQLPQSLRQHCCLLYFTMLSVAAACLHPKLGSRGAGAMSCGVSVVMASQIVCWNIFPGRVRVRIAMRGGCSGVSARGNTRAPCFSGDVSVNAH